MKKEKRWKKMLLSSICAFALLGTGFFTSCSNGDDDSSGSAESSDPTTNTETGGTSGSENAGSSEGTGAGDAEVDTSLTDGIYLIKKGDEANKTKQETITAALAAIPSDAAATDTYIIQISAGTYEENELRYAGSANLVILGNTETELGADVIIKGRGKDPAISTSMRDRCLFSVTGTANLTLKNVTFEQITDKRTLASGQAEAVSFFSTGKLVAYNSSFYGHQDTLFSYGKNWFYKCYVEGDVDFIWQDGAKAVVALFEECHIHMTNEESPNASYVAAPRYDLNNGKLGKGVVFLNSKVTSDEGLSGKAYLARSVANADQYTQVAYVNTTFDGPIATKVWYGSASTMVADGVEEENIGWKIDSATAEKLSALACDLDSVCIMSDRMTEREYNGRYVILNRLFNSETKKWETDADKWDVDSEFNFGQSEDSSKNNIFLDYADVTKTSIGDTLIVSDYNGSTTATWTAQAYSEIELKNEVADAVSIDSEGKTTKTGTGNIYVKVTATKDGVSDSIIVYSVTATSIALSDSEASIAEGSEKQLSVSFEPYGAAADVEWTSSDSTVATVDSNGLVKALAGQSGKTATITATVKDNAELTVSCTITVTDAAVLKKFGTSVADLTSFSNYETFGASDVLVYPVAIDASSNATATYEISAKLTYSKVANGGVGFVSFKDGAYSDGAMRSYAWTTPAGVKSYDGYSAHGQGYDKDYKTYANAVGEYTVKAYTKKDGYFYFSLTNSDGEELLKPTAVGYYVPCASDYIYLAIGGAEGFSVSASDITITINDGTNENSMVVAKFEDLAADTRTALTGSGSASYEMTAADFSSYKGMEDTIDLSNIATSGLSVSPSVEGSWQWDGTASLNNAEVSTVKNSGSSFTAKATFIPSDRSTYKAVLGQDVSITVTDSRAEASGTVVTETFKLGTGTTTAAEDPADDVVAASDITWNSTSATADAAVITSAGYIYIPEGLTTATADYSYQTTISATKAAKITSIKAEAGNKGSTGNVQTDVYLSTNDGSTWTKIGEIVANIGKSTYKALDYSTEVSLDASTSAIIQFRPYWLSARSSGSYTSRGDFVVIVQYE